MRILSLSIQFLIVVIAARFTDSPHGSDFDVSCSVCHSPKGWELDMEIYSFDHNTTNLPLEGQHTTVNCKLCHPSLVFSEAGTECFDCHTDMHQQTVGFDCARCHTTESWIVKNITEVHQHGRFPLFGPHQLADCIDCHPSASLLQFGPLGIECLDCHMDEYNATTTPNHVLGNISTDCIECHSMNAFTWTGSGFNHLFFPLTQGHAVNECDRCHTGGDYSNISAECYSCHQSDFSATTNPNHTTAGISSDCIECHTTLSGWKPAEFTMHEELFSLTQGHAIYECGRCHDINDYANVSADCAACHLPEYNATTNPNHTTAGISSDCQECHTTLPGWKPAEFTMHDAFFPLTQGHAISECDRCHNIEDYSGATSDCYSCHQPDYNATTNPGHVATALSTDCLECHTTLPGWKPAQFLVHDSQFFPIYSGKHREEWDNCTDCHVNTSSWAAFSCINCHEHSNQAEVNDDHKEVVDYQYNSMACLECHPREEKKIKDII